MSNETVTILLETYDNMKLEIESLKKQVEEKTIIKEVYPPIFDYFSIAIIIVILIASLYTITLH
jgi:hypothetical protein